MSLLPTAMAARLASWLPRRPGAPTAADFRLVRRIADAGPQFAALSPAALRGRAADLRHSVHAGSRQPASEQVMLEGFALVNEALWRCLKIRFFDVQYLAAMTLVRGQIAEMATGEGKTLVQALASSVLALRGEGVHVMTSNAYLAERDFRQLSPVFATLGLSAGLLQPHSPPQAKRDAYRADITYGAGYEFGFDYLRDQTSLQQQRRPRLGDTVRRQLQGWDAEPPVTLQRGHAVAIVDEADCVMLDEATTPLILAATPPAEHPFSDAYVHAAHLAAHLADQRHFVLDPQQRFVRLTRQGLAEICSTAHLPKGLALERPWPVYVEQALLACYFLRRDIDYVVTEGRVGLVDHATGRVFADRSLRNGLHQAVEAKERLEITAPRQTLAGIPRQRFLRLYRLLCGMTGTACEAAPEFREIYQRRVVVIPARIPCRRIVLPARFFGSQVAKRAALVELVRQRHAAGQPVLIGTRTIAESEHVAALLDEARMPYQLLNGVQDLAESSIVARAGQAGAITIATNIAGRGTDIILGPGVPQLGGLMVIATEPHASRRLDRQLAGRAARQGDPGSYQLLVSADDDLIALFDPRLAQAMRRLAGPDGEIDRDLSRHVARLQLRVARRNFDQRRQLMRHNAWLEDVLASLSGRDPAV